MIVEADKPGVPVILGRPGFAGRKALQFRGATGFPSRTFLCFGFWRSICLKETRDQEDRLDNSKHLAAGTLALGTGTSFCKNKQHIELSIIGVSGIDAKMEPRAPPSRWSPLFM
jgi:hypothetical protein